MKAICLFLFLMCSALMFGQRGYAKDSIQIKLYADIQYDDNQPKKIEVRKIFCDYCSEKQIETVKYEGWRRAYSERYFPENRMLKGTKKLTLIIRLAKKDFSAINN